jgi:hypothetical protein
MGYKIAQNIFSKPPIGSSFRKFKFQVLVLFDDHLHPTFADGFQKKFKSLHERTGRDVVFFAATRVPMDYASWDHDAERFKAEQLELGQYLNPQASELLVAEIGRRFKLKMSDLPAVVVARELWSGPWVVVPGVHLADDAAGILEGVLQLAQQSDGLPEGKIGRLRFWLEQNFETVRWLPSDPRLQDRLKRVYAVSAKLHGDMPPREIIRGLLSQSPISDWRNPGNEDDTTDENLYLDHAGEVAIAYAAVDPLYGRLDYPAIAALESDSRIFLQTSTLVSRALRAAENANAFDHTIAVAPLWKAVELEFNLSVFQLLRCTHGIEMPSYFNRLKPNLGHLPIDVAGQKFYLNRPRRDAPENVEWPTLGGAHLLLPKPFDGQQFVEDPWRTALTAFGEGDVDNLREVLVRLNQVRRGASHVARLLESDANEVRSLIRDNRLFERFVAVKSKLYLNNTRRLDAKQLTSVDIIAGCENYFPNDPVNLLIHLRGITPREREILNLALIDLKNYAVDNSVSLAAVLGRVIAALATVQSEMLEEQNTAALNHRKILGDSK